MKSQKPVYNRPDELPNEISRPLIPVMISVIGHLVIFGIFILGPKIPLRPDITPRVIDVTLVSMTPGIKGGSPKSGAAAVSAHREKSETPSPPKAEKLTEAKPSEPKAPEPKVPEPKPPEPKPPQPKPPEPKPPEPKPPVIQEQPKVAPDKEVISLAPAKTTPKVSLKTQTYDPVAVKKNMIQSVAKKVEETRPEQPDPNSTLAKSLDRIRDQVAKKEREAAAAGAGEGKTGGSPTGQGRPGGGVTGEGPPGNGPFGEGSGPELIYRSQIANVIRQNWAYSEQLAEKNKNLTAWVMLEILPDGKIRDFWFERRSGNAYLDDSVARAIQKSNPLPPFPPGIRQSSIHQGFRFTPMGMQ